MDAIDQRTKNEMSKELLLRIASEVELWKAERIEPTADTNVKMEANAVVIFGLATMLSATICEGYGNLYTRLAALEAAAELVRHLIKDFTIGKKPS